MPPHRPSAGLRTILLLRPPHAAERLLCLEVRHGPAVGGEHGIAGRVLRAGPLRLRAASAGALARDGITGAPLLLVLDGRCVRLLERAPPSVRQTTARLEALQDLTTSTRAQ